MLKRGGLVTSVKGAQGGYLLSRTPGAISVYDVLSAVEGSLFEATEDTVASTAPEIEKAMRTAAFDTLDKSVKDTLTHVTLDDLMSEAEKHKKDNTQMFYI